MNNRKSKIIKTILVIMGIFVVGLLMCGICACEDDELKIRNVSVECSTDGESYAKIRETYEVGAELYFKISFGSEGGKWASSTYNAEIVFETHDNVNVSYLDGSGVNTNATDKNGVKKYKFKGVKAENYEMVFEVKASAEGQFSIGVDFGVDVSDGYNFTKVIYFI